VDNGAEEDRKSDGSTSSSTTWRTCSSKWRMPRIELNGEGEPVCLTPHLRDPQPEGERERERLASLAFTSSTVNSTFSKRSLSSLPKNICRLWDISSIFCCKY